MCGCVGVCVRARVSGTLTAGCDRNYAAGDVASSYLGRGCGHGNPQSRFHLGVCGWVDVGGCLGGVCGWMYVGVCGWVGVCVVCVE